MLKVELLNYIDALRDLYNKLPDKKFELHTRNRLRKMKKEELEVVLANLKSVLAKRGMISTPKDPIEIPEEKEEIPVEEPVVKSVLKPIIKPVEIPIQPEPTVEQPKGVFFTEPLVSGVKIIPPRDTYMDEPDLEDDYDSDDEEEKPKKTSFYEYMMFAGVMAGLMVGTYLTTIKPVALPVIEKNDSNNKK